MELTMSIATASRRIDNRTRMAVAMFGVLLLSYVINAMDRQLFPLLVADVREHYGFSLADSGLLSTVFTLGMGLAGIPSAFLMTRLSRKNVVLIGIAVYSVTTALTAFAAGFWDMFAYRAVSGLGEAMQLTALLAIAGSYFTKYRSAAIGSVNLSFALGGAIGPVLGGALLANYNWQVPLVVFGLLGFVLMAAVALTAKPWLTEVQGSKVDPVEQSQDAREPEAQVHAIGAPTFLNRNTLLLAGATAMGGMAIYGYLGMYPTFLRQQLGFSVAEMSGVMSIFGLGALLSIVGGIVGDKFSARPVLTISFAIGLVLAFLLFTGPAAFAYQAAFSFIWGAVISGTTYVNLAGAHVKAVLPHLSSKASGIFVTCLYVPAAFSGYLVGALATSFGWQSAGIWGIGTAAVLGGILTFFLKSDNMAK
jgi:DHA1 family inner membrane transport protein